MQLRPYQQQAVDSAIKDLGRHSKALVVAATGAGKSLIIAEVCKRFLSRFPDKKILALCYVREILESNHQKTELYGLESGIYCAGMGQKDCESSVVHGSRQSVAMNIDDFIDRDLVILDECHMLNPEEGQYQQIIDTINPKFCMGLTATPYRTAGGWIYGKRKFWPKVSYEIGMKQLTEMGFLSPLEYQEHQLVDVSDVKIVRGDYDAKQLDAKLKNQELIDTSLKTWHAHAKDRNLTLFFCHSREHAKECREAFRNLYPELIGAYLDGTTKSKEREELIESARDGLINAIFSVATLTTGTDIPPIDCICWLRPTQSAVLWVQGTGRGVRLAQEKDNCKVIDLVGNRLRLGDVDNPEVKPQGSGKKPFTPEELLEMGIDPKEVKGEAPTKECDNCKAIIHAASKKCDDCGLLQVKIEVGKYLDVIRIEYFKTQTRRGDDCVIAHFYTTARKTPFKKWYIYRHPWAMNELNRMRKQGVKQICVVKRDPFDKVSPIFKNSS